MLVVPRWIHQIISGNCASSLCHCECATEIDMSWIWHCTAYSTTSIIHSTFLPLLQSPVSETSGQWMHSIWASYHGNKICLEEWMDGHTNKRMDVPTRQSENTEPSPTLSRGKGTKIPKWCSQFFLNKRFRDAQRSMRVEMLSTAVQMMQTDGTSAWGALLATVTF